MKGFKVTDSNRERMFGVACETLSQLLEKGVRRLGITDDVYLALDDGTILDDEEYFQMIPPQTIVIFYRKNEPVITGADYILKLLRMINAGYLAAGEEASRFVKEKTHELMTAVLREGKPVSNTRQGDPDWFANLDTNAATKEDYMFRKSQERIKGYLYKFQGDVRRNAAYVDDAKTRRVMDECIGYFRKKLQRDEYFGCFFDRRFSRLSQDDTYSKRKKLKGEETDPVTPTYQRVSYCDADGRFLCQGKWDVKDCEFGYRHVINPYLDRESRILFSTWNLDHRIEKTRTVVPTLFDAVKNRRKEQCINYDYFYQLLFTNYNLKLVHVVCHDKTSHSASCDMKFVYKR